MKRLAAALEEYRAVLTREAGREVPLFVTSGFRCAKHNRDVRGSKFSKHMDGIAADVYPQGYNLYESAMLINSVEALQRGGAGLYIGPDGHGWVHLDVRTEGRARWGQLVSDGGNIELTFEQALGIAKEVEMNRARRVDADGQDV
jgi:uncharacterized protein YcbK (DUF882 family)